MLQTLLAMQLRLALHELEAGCQPAGSATAAVRAGQAAGRLGWLAVDEAEGPERLIGARLRCVVKAVPPLLNVCCSVMATAAHHSSGSTAAGSSPAASAPARPLGERLLLGAQCRGVPACSLGQVVRMAARATRLASLQTVVLQPPMRINAHGFILWCTA